MVNRSTVNGKEIRDMTVMMMVTNVLQTKEKRRETEVKGK